MDSNIEEKIRCTLSSRIRDEKVVRGLTRDLLRGAHRGLEISASFSEEEWFEKRFEPQLTWLDQNDYARALVRSLWLAPKFAPTDFGASRQRDFAQVWADTARGFLGEVAFQKFFQEKFDTRIELDVRRGSLEVFLPSDVRSVNGRPPQKKLSIKTTKFNGIWLDVPGAQFEHSDIFVLVKLGISRLHFLTFLKDVSFLKEKLFDVAIKLGELNEQQARELLEETPDFVPIPAYVAGYIEKRGPPTISQIAFKIKRGKEPRIVITSGVGLFSPEEVRKHPNIRKVDPEGKLPIEIHLIMKSLKEKHFLANSGALNFGLDAWRRLLRELRPD